MKRVTGIGGLFFQCNDPATQRAWYAEHLGIESDQWGSVFRWREQASPKEQGYTVWSPFPADTTYFAPSPKPFMFNYRVADLTALLAALKDEGVEVIGEMKQEENGKFAWILDPEGNKIELWEPVPSDQDPYLPKDGD